MKPARRRVIGAGERDMLLAPLQTARWAGARFFVASTVQESGHRGPVTNCTGAVSLQEGDSISLPLLGRSRKSRL